MQLGFVSAILPEQSLESVFQIASELAYDCVELMCWPVGGAMRRGCRDTGRWRRGIR